MLKTHTTNDGQTRLICQMETRHLLNTCLSVARSAMKTVAMVNKAVDPRTIYANQLYGRTSERPLKPEEAAQTVKEKLTFLYPYLAELYLRAEEVEKDRELCSLNGELKNYLLALTPRDNGLMLSAGVDNDDDTPIPF